MDLFAHLQLCCIVVSKDRRFCLLPLKGSNTKEGAVFPFHLTLAGEIGCIMTSRELVVLPFSISQKLNICRFFFFVRVNVLICSLMFVVCFVSVWTPAQLLLRCQLGDSNKHEHTYHIVIITVSLVLTMKYHLHQIWSSFTSNQMHVSVCFHLS